MSAKHELILRRTCTSAGHPPSCRPTASSMEPTLVTGYDLSKHFHPGLPPDEGLMVAVPRDGGINSSLWAVGCVEGDGGTSRTVRMGGFLGTTGVAGRRPGPRGWRHRCPRPGCAEAGHVWRAHSFLVPGRPTGRTSGRGGPIVRPSPVGFNPNVAGVERSCGRRWNLFDEETISW
jgi:hypothetical protein